MYTTLITAEQLRECQLGNLVILDCRFQLTDPEYGLRVYQQGHIPGAHYVSLDYHLSGTKTGNNGRHPLPDGQRLAVDLGAWGIDGNTQVVTYDDAGGMFAARAWWLLRWLGHEAVAVLNGGMAAWSASGGELSQDLPQRQSTRFAIRPSLVKTVTAADVLDNLQSHVLTVVDARSAERFRGEGETMDPVGGHIPGAENRFFMHNLAEKGEFKQADQLRKEWLELLGQQDDWADIVHQCGSGVTACVNVLSMESAGLKGSRLYPGSWSEWCSDASRPVAR